MQHEEQPNDHEIGAVNDIKNSVYEGEWRWRLTGIGRDKVQKDLRRN